MRTHGANDRFGVVESDEAPKISVCPQAIVPRHDGHPLYLSGQVGLDPKTMRLLEGGIEPEVRQTIANIRAILRTAGLTLDDVVKMEILLADMDHYPLVNKIYGEEFGGHRPARVAYAVQELPLGAQVEMVATAWMPRSKIT